MPRSQQLFLQFDQSERQTQKPPQAAIEESLPDMPAPAIATDDLRRKIAAYLRDADQEIGIHELRSEMGFHAIDTDPDPLANPVNRILKEMRDAGEVICVEPEWGEPRFSLPSEESIPADFDAADIKGNEMAKRQLLVAAASGQPIRIEGPAEQREQFRSLADILDVPIEDDKGRLVVLVQLQTPHRREVETLLQGASTADMRKALAEMNEDVPDEMLDGAEEVLGATVRTEHIAKSVEEMVRTVASAIARLERSPAIHPAHMAEAINYCVTEDSPKKKPPEPSKDAPPLVRPDRQLTYDGLPHWEWPKAREDRDTITVDRLYDDIDGPSHRFIVRRGDTVEVFFSRTRTDIAEVVGISLAKRQVRVRFQEGTDGLWMSVGNIYPAPPEEPAPRRKGEAPLSEIVEAASSPPPDGFTDGDRVEPVSKEPFTFDDFRKYRQTFEAGDITAVELKAEFTRLRQSKDAFCLGLTKRYDAAQLKRLAARFGCFDAKRNTKPQNAESIYRTVLQSFTLSDSVMWSPLSGQTIEDAVAQQVDGVTEEELQQYYAEQKKAEEFEKQAIEDPKTLADFQLFIRRKGIDELTPSQRVSFEEVHADHTRDQRAERRAASMVGKIRTEEAAKVQLSIREGWHAKRDIPLWIVQLGERVDRSAFNELKVKAKQLGGWYSSFKRDQAGFQFTDEDAARRFAALQEEDVDRSDVLAARKERKIESASERLISAAETLESEAEEALQSDETRLKNTVRRAEMAASMRGQAYASQAMARTLRSIAAALAGGDTNYLDGVWARTHVETLINLLRRGKTERNKKLLEERGELGVWQRHNAVQEMDNRPMEAEDAASCTYPYPSVYRRHLEEAVAIAKNRRGVKKIARRFDSFLITDRDRHFVDFTDENDIGLLAEFVDRCKGVSIETRWIEQGMDDYRRLQAANIHTPQEMRCALRELASHLARKRDDDPVQKLEQQLIGREIPGFFPTPKAIVSRMLELTEIEPNDRVLEPSAGKGDILDLIRSKHPDARVTAVEINAALLEILGAKGHAVEQGDFLGHKGEYDRVVMNPPFENGQDIDHIRHAFDLVAPGGRVVAVISEGPFFRQDKKAEEFRRWLDELGGESEQLPEDAFKGIDAFRQTGVRTRIVSIERGVLALEQPADASRPETTQACGLGESDRQKLGDAKTQEQYQLAYREQMSRSFCPGCGETEIF